MAAPCEVAPHRRREWRSAADGRRACRPRASPPVLPGPPNQNVSHSSRTAPDPRDRPGELLRQGVARDTDPQPVEIGFLVVT